MISREEMKRRIEENRKEIETCEPSVWSTLSPSWARINCGQRNKPKPTLDQYDGAPVNR